jgi:hypothetical protein
MKKKNLIIIGSVLLGVILLGWVFIESTKPLPGVEQLENDRTHIAEGSPIAYKYNPPTSGTHYPSWILKGFYDLPFPDGNLVHSQEHGYIIMWYDCTVAPTAFSFVPAAYAQAAGSLGMTGGNIASPSATLEQMPAQFSNGSCDTTKSKLKDIINKYGPHKLIAVPRFGMGAPLVLTAWGRSEKLTSLDEVKIKEFIDAFRDRGPENTNEP